MTNSQKVIKAFAFTLAILLIILIFTFTISVISNIFNISFYKEEYEVKVVNVSSKISDLVIELESSKLFIKDADV